MSERCDLARVSLGAYVLGGLDAAERAHVDTHLTRCARCREEVARLGEVTELLAAIPVERLEPRPRLRVRALLAVAAVVAAVVAGGFAFTPRLGEPQRPEAMTVTGTDPATRVAARVVLIAREDRTTAALHLRGIRPHEHCRLIVVAADGTRRTAASWRATYEGVADVRSTPSVPLRTIAALEVIAEHRGRLIRLTVPRNS